MVRVGRGVAYSCMRHYGWSAETAAIDWRCDIMRANKLLTQCDRHKWRLIRYEDLCLDPQAAIEKLCIFLDIDPSQVNMDFWNADLHVFGNQMRLSPGQAICLDERWRKELTDLQISTMQRIARKQLLKYGY